MASPLIRTVLVAIERGAGAPGAGSSGGPLPVSSADLVSTYCFVSTAAGLAQVVWVDIDTPVAGAAEVRLRGRGLACVRSWRGQLAAGATTRAEVAVLVAGSRAPGTEVDVEVVVEAPSFLPLRLPARLVVREPGWTMYMVSHFHYDPVWWNTQAAYTSAWDELAWAQDSRDTFQQTGLVLVECHLERARLDPDYKFVLAEVDYLKPFWDLYPDRRQEVRRLLAEGRLEIVGGTYNEPNTNLTAFETGARCAVYGMGFQRDVLGATPETAWQLDVFAHDPSFPSLMAACGVTSSSWARGPFHQWGPKHHTGSTRWMQFPSEFEWLGPDGAGIVTSYMADHYSAGWQLDQAQTLDEATSRAYALFCDLAAVSATRATLLPVGTDYTPPNKWVTKVARAWAARYEWPRFVPALPKEFFAALRAELRGAGVAPLPETREMGPVYTGKDVSFIDTKQANRLAETVLCEAERLATLALALGHPYPHRATDKAWRQLVFNSHHDGITGSESDQVYLDLLGGWREAYELASQVRSDALGALASHVEAPAGSVVVLNSLGTTRGGLVSAAVDLAVPSGQGAVVTDDAGMQVPAVFKRLPSGPGGPERLQVDFLARDVPGLGYRCYTVGPGAGPLASWAPVAGVAVQNERFRVEADPVRGGCLSRVTDRASGRDVLAQGEVGNELLVYPEYPTHPTMAEGPWHLMPAGPPERSSAGPALVRAERCPLGERLVVAGSVGNLKYTQVVTLLSGAERVDLELALHGFSGSDQLVRLRFPFALVNSRPLAEVGHAVVARSFGFVDEDAAGAPWTLDTPAQAWAGTGTTFKVEWCDGDQPVGSWPLGVAEVVLPPATPGLRASARSLLVALLQKGVTASCSEATSNRYGALLGDSNLPDVRVVVGGPDDSSLARAVLSDAPAGFGEELSRQLAGDGTARLWVPAKAPLGEVWKPNADLRGPRDLPVLLVAGTDAAATERALEVLAADVASGRCAVRQPSELYGAPVDAADFSAAVVNMGTPGFVVDIDGALYVSLLRACTGWPSGVWIDPPRRTAPDGSNFELEHWSHSYAHALVAGKGDWRELGFVDQARSAGAPLAAWVKRDRPGELAASGSFLELSCRTGSVVLTALKPSGNPLAAGLLEEPGSVAGLEGANPATKAGSTGTVGPSTSTAVRAPGEVDVTARLYESHGSEARATLRPSAAFELVGAWSTDLLEELPRPLAIEGDKVLLHLGPAETKTVRLRLRPRSDPTGPGAQAVPPPGQAAPVVEPAQPVFSRYWLHNKGPAPMGNQLVALHVVPNRVRLRAGAAGFSFAATLASSALVAAQAGHLELELPGGWAAEPPARLYNLAPGAHVRVPVEVSLPSRTLPGRYFVSASTTDLSGQRQEDVVTVEVLGALGLATGHGPTTPPLRWEDVPGQSAAAIEAALVSERIRLRPGERLPLRLTLRNHARSPVRGEAQLLSPLETWPMAGPWSQGFSVPASGTSSVTFDVEVPPCSGPLSSWLLVKLMYFGHLWYSPAVELEVLADC